MHDSPQSCLAAMLDHYQPHRLLTVSLNPVPVAEQWAADHDCELTQIHSNAPLPDLKNVGRMDVVLVADQLEYMPQQDGQALIGVLRNLHSDTVIATYQPALAPDTLRWPHNDFFALGCREVQTFEQDNRQLTIYHYELANYNFTRSWNNPRFWANPENWGKYWW